MAGEPVSADWLADHVQRSRREVRERASLRWRRFLVREQRQGEEQWRIVHQSFADFLRVRADGVDLRAAHRDVAAFYLLEPGTWLAHDNYASRHLSIHLLEAGEFSKLFELVDSPSRRASIRRPSVPSSAPHARS